MCRTLTDRPTPELAPLFLESQLPKYSQVLEQSSVV